MRHPFEAPILLGALRHPREYEGCFGHPSYSLVSCALHAESEGQENVLFLRVLRCTFYFELRLHSVALVISESRSPINFTWRLCVNAENHAQVVGKFNPVCNSLGQLPQQHYTNIAAFSKTHTHTAITTQTQLLI